VLGALFGFNRQFAVVIQMQGAGKSHAPPKDNNNGQRFGYRYTIHSDTFKFSRRTAKLFYTFKAINLGPTANASGLKY